ncbi:MAG: transcription-repair coupling factor [Bdellovibrionales bacterium]|nr:transcription-repair coupling factor [Bdellovibrionales bacterium]
MLNLEIVIKQLKSGQNHKISLPPHSFLVAYLLFRSHREGPHILVSSQKKVFEQIKNILLFLEPEQKIFSLIDIPFPWQESLSFSSLTEIRKLQLIALAQKASPSDIFMIHPQVLRQRVVCPDLFRKKCLQLKPGQSLPWPFVSTLKELGYQSRDYVEQIGEFSMRGAVLDIFSPFSNHPLRLELMGEEIIQIKTFDISTQKSLREIKEAFLSPIREGAVYNKKETYQKIKKMINARTKEKKPFPSFKEWNLFLNSPNFKTEGFSLYNDLKPWRASLIHQSPFSILDYFFSPLIWNLEAAHSLIKTLDLWEEEIKKWSEQNPLYPTFSDICVSNKQNKLKREITFDPFFIPKQHRKQTPSHLSSLERKEETTSPPGPCSHELQKEKTNYSNLMNTNLTYLTSPSFLKNFFHHSDWPQKIKEQKKKGFFIFICVEKEKIRRELKTDLESVGIKGKEEKSWFDMQESQQKNYLTVHLIKSFQCEPFIWPQENIFLLNTQKFRSQRREIKDSSSSALFMNKKTPQQKKTTAKKYKQALHFSQLKPGDLAIHRQHGLGLFKKLDLLDFGTGYNEFLILEYRNGDLLYVPVYTLHQVQKYSSPLSPTIKNQLLDKLGDTRWLNTKEKVKKKMKDMAMELINLYSVRSSLKRKVFPSTSKNFDQFETEFPFTETLDQKKAIEDIIKDISQKQQPADRLICGDTGFGKTEVAMRAAFKVMEEGFQVGLMAPTTILSFQHFERFKERFKNWPFLIRLLNRFTPPPERKNILKETKEGKVDILIGTHRILSQDLQFKKLGLLIIDEEHLFGVKSKEKLKNWYSHVDTISLSATPIPRSLSMSLSGIRDMSVILTPPLNRKPVHTFISPFKESLIKTAILKELDRKGQVIFIHNRIADIHIMEDKIKKLLPTIRIRTAHGKKKDLQQKTVLDFFYQKFDLLLCTTIVESGMDFPKANTLFINQAEKFGLSQLHQLRGRIGRSDRSSYCYLLIDPRKNIPQPAMERLKIIQENNQPGAGIAVAQYDLEMRGAGELMGAEQSGFLQNIGYEMYFEFLQEMISSLKTGKPKSIPEPDLKFKQPAFLPKNYIPHEKTRLLFYKKLATANSEEEIEQVKAELEDFAGTLPEETKNLILLSHFRLLAKKAHIRELSHKPPFLYMSLADSTPLSPSQVLQWIEEGLCEWQNKNTLKFALYQTSIEIKDSELRSSPRRSLQKSDQKGALSHPCSSSPQNEDLLHIWKLLKNLFYKI